MATKTNFAKAKGPIWGAKADKKTEKDLRRARAGSLSSTSLSPRKQKRSSQTSTSHARTNNIYNGSIKQNTQA